MNDVADRRTDRLDIVDGSGSGNEFLGSHHGLLESDLGALQLGPYRLLARSEAIMACELGVDRADTDIAARERIEFALELSRVDVSASVAELLAVAGRFPALFDTSVQRITDLKKAGTQRTVRSFLSCLGEAGLGAKGVSHEETPGFPQSERVDPGRERSNTIGDLSSDEDPDDPYGNGPSNSKVQGAACEEYHSDTTGNHCDGEGGDHGEKHRGFETTRHSWGG